MDTTGSRNTVVRSTGSLGEDLAASRRGGNAWQDAEQARDDVRAIATGQPRRRRLFQRPRRDTEWVSLETGHGEYDPSDSPEQRRRRDYRWMEKSRIDPSQKKYLNSLATDSEHTRRRARRERRLFMVSVVATSLGMAALFLTSLLLYPAQGGFSLHMDARSWCIAGGIGVVMYPLIYLLMKPTTRRDTDTEIRIGTNYELHRGDEEDTDRKITWLPFGAALVTGMVCVTVWFIAVVAASLM